MTYQGKAQVVLKVPKRSKQLKIALWITTVSILTLAGGVLMFTYDIVKDLASYLVLAAVIVCGPALFMAITLKIKDILDGMIMANINIEDGVLTISLRDNDSAAIDLKTFMSGVSKACYWDAANCFFLLSNPTIQLQFRSCITDGINIASQDYEICNFLRSLGYSVENKYEI